MAGIIEKYGGYIGKLAPKHPVAARKMLLTGFKLFGFKLDHMPDKRLPESRKFLASLLNDIVVDMLKHPEKAALTSVLTPCELLYAADINPLCAELYSSFVNGAHAERYFAELAEEKGISETFCSYHKVLLGGAYAGVFPKPAFIVNTSLICDANNLTFRELSKHFGIDQFYIDVPDAAGDDCIDYVADQLRELKVFIEDHTHKKITDDKIRTLVGRSGKTIENLLKAQPLRAEKYLAGDMASELYEIYITHIGLGTEKTLKYTELLLEDLKKAEKAHGTRILWVHTIPNWQKPLRDMFNYNENATIISCDMNYDSLLVMDPEKPYESMAKRLVNSTFNGDGNIRIKASADMAKRLNADGAIVFCHWGCKQTMGRSGRLKEELTAAGIPTLVLDGDGCDERNSSDGQVATRLNAFMEMLGYKG